MYSQSPAAVLCSLYLERELKDRRVRGKRGMGILQLTRRGIWGAVRPKKKIKKSVEAAAECVLVCLSTFLFSLLCLWPNLCSTHVEGLILPSCGEMLQLSCSSLCFQLFNLSVPADFV